MEESVARRWGPYTALAGVVLVLALAGAIPRWPGVVQMVGLPPLDVLADVRVLLAAAPSWPVFGLGAVTSVAVRALVLAAALGFSRRRVAFALRFYVAALPFAVVAAGLDFTGRAVLYVYGVWLGLAVTVITFIVLAGCPWVGVDRLHQAAWQAFRSRRSFGTLFLYLFLVATLGALSPLHGGWLAVGLVPVSALLTIVTARRLSGTTPRARVHLGRHRPHVAVPALVAFALASTMISPTTTPVARGRRGSLFLVAGVDTDSGGGSMFRLDPRALGYACSQTFYFSYAGTGHGARRKDAVCPITTGSPYRKTDTTRPLRALVATFAQQVRELPAPVVVVTHSQGAWIAWSALAAGRASAVSDLVMLGPFGEGLAAYPRRGHSGSGATGGDVVRLVTRIGRDVGFNTFDPDRPLARQLQATPGAIASLLGRPLPRDVRSLAVLSRLDLPLVPGTWPLGTSEACPGWVAHGGLPESDAVTHAARRFLDGRGAGDCPSWVRLLARPVTAFGIPSPTAP